MVKHLLSQLGHVELLTASPDESVVFFREVLGLEESHREGQSVYLRGWGEFFHHSLKVTESHDAGVGHIGWRTDGPEELERAVDLLDQSGLGEGWHDGDIGHGAAYRFRDPGGHMAEIFWDVEWYEPPPELKSPLLNRPQKYVPRGAAVRRVDHVTVAAPDVPGCREFYVDNLGFKHMEGTVLDHNSAEVAAFVSTGPMSHDLGIIADMAGGTGRLNHVAFWLDTREEVMRAADVMRDAGVFVEAGPGRHAIGENFFLYVHEPGGNRVELFSGGYQIYAPDWGPITWKVSERGDSYWLTDFPRSLWTYNTPAIEVPESVEAPKTTRT